MLGPRPPNAGLGEDAVCLKQYGQRYFVRVGVLPCALDAEQPNRSYMEIENNSQTVIFQDYINAMSDWANKWQLKLS